MTGRLLTLAAMAVVLLAGAGAARAASERVASERMASDQASDQASVIPAPASLSEREGSFALLAHTPILVPQDPEAVRIAAYFAQLLEQSHGLKLAVHASRGSAAPSGATGGIAFELDPAAPGVSPESYEIEVSPRGVRVAARAPRGLFYGAVTLWQLSSALPLKDGGLQLPAMLITDSPRFPWRGLMLDSARHFQSPEFILRYLDWMALHKLNVLGWHLTDDQGWRLQIKRYPRLTGVGAWRVPQGRVAQRDVDPATHRPRLYGGFYTQEQVRRIVAHAAERNITIVPEIDMPGHATAAIVAYPELGVTEPAPRAVPSDWGTYPNLFNVEESTFTFLEQVLDEVMALFPSQFIHTGGDEAVKDQWIASARAHARMRELGVPDEKALQGYFTRRLGEYLSAHGRRLIGWDEILEGGVPPDAVVMSWRGVEGAIAAARGGHDAVLSPAPTLYLDNRQGSAPSEPPGRGRVVSLEDVYRFDPLPDALASDARRVIGLQANLWTEHVTTEEDAAYMTWPRAAAVAELGWSPAGRLDWNDFLRRLPAEFDRYRTLGIHYSDDVFTPVRSVGLYERHMSQDLGSCSDKLVLNLPDDAPRQGPRAVFLIDIEDPCWVFPAADLTHARSFAAAVGRVPFNYQIGKARDAIRFDAPSTAAGELLVRLDGCGGAPIAVLPLAPAVDNDSVTVLPRVSLPPITGVHRLCLRFAQHGLDPLWAIDWVRLAP